MFQNALMESGGQLTTNSKYFSIAGLIINSCLLTALILWPLLHPLSLPKQAIAMLLIAPVPPAPAATVARSSAAPSARNVLLALQPLLTATPRLHNNEEAAAPGDLPTGITGIPGGDGASTIGSLFTGASTPHPTVLQAAPKKIAISSGVMAGNKISGSAPAYPAIAKAARIQGTVVLAAVISPSGTIENLRVVSGPPMLTASALESVKSWRYKPYLLNSQPVAVETTINIVFNLGN